MWYSGIDQHKRDSVITTYGPDGPRVKQARVPSTPLALQRYFAEFPGPHQAVVEPTGSRYWLADVLGGLGAALVLAHATRLKAICAAKVETDQVDSDVLALLLRAGLIPEAHMIRPEPRGRTRHRSGSKAGNRSLTLAFSHAGIRAVPYDPEIRAFFKAKARRKPIKIARTLVALELARIVYHVLTKQEDFNGRFKNQPLSHRKHAHAPRVNGA